MTVSFHRFVAVPAMLAPGRRRGGPPPAHHASIRPYARLPLCPCLRISVPVCGLACMCRPGVESVGQVGGEVPVGQAREFGGAGGGLRVAGVLEDLVSRVHVG